MWVAPFVCTDIVPRGRQSSGQGAVTPVPRPLACAHSYSLPLRKPLRPRPTHHGPWLATAVEQATAGLRGGEPDAAWLAAEQARTDALSYW